LARLLSAESLDTLAHSFTRHRQPLPTGDLRHHACCDQEVVEQPEARALQRPGDHVTTAYALDGLRRERVGRELLLDALDGQAEPLRQQLVDVLPRRALPLRLVHRHQELL
jgi:hypothetical protein